MSGNEKEPQKHELESRFNISGNEFATRYGAYRSRYLSVVNDTTLNLKDSVQVDTLGICFWEMDMDEVRYMVDKINDIDTIDNHPVVRIYPTIYDEPNESNMDLIFEITDNRNKTSDYYDFTKPCPPTCGTLELNSNCE